MALERQSVGNSDPDAIFRWQEAGAEDVPAADVQILTSAGRRIRAHSSVLASASPVLERLVDRAARKRGKSDRIGIIPIPGVPCGAVLAFLRFLYSTARWEHTCEMEEYGMHLVVLSHVYQVRWLKSACEAALAARLSSEVVVDVLQLARLCDAPRLELRCLKLVHKDFAAVERTEAWRFLQDNDPWLELDVLQFLHQADQDLKKTRRRRRMRKMMEEEEEPQQQLMYLQLSEAMDCLSHIFSEGCTDTSRTDHQYVEAGKRLQLVRPSCPSSTTCRSLGLLLRHLAVCGSAKGRAACRGCRQMWNLLRLHSSVCELRPDPDCNVPLCKKFKMRRLQFRPKEGKGSKDDDGKWRILAKKVVSAKVMSCLAKRRRQDHLEQL